MGPLLNSDRILIDTNIIIDFLIGRSQAVSFFESISPKTNQLISTITVTELYAGIKTDNEEQTLNLFLQNYQIVGIGQTIGREGGLIKNKYNSSNGIGLADAIIAATALEKKAKLITLNLKHFPMVGDKNAPY